MKLPSKFYRLRSRYWRNNRMLWPSPAEVAFVRVMGGRVITVPFCKHPRNGFKLAWVLSLGKTLRSHKFQREVRCGSKYCDFGNDLKWAIEIDGRRYHNDIVVQQQRDEYFAKYGWRVLHVDARDVFWNVNQTRDLVHKFLNT